MKVIIAVGKICSGKTTYLSSFTDEYCKVDVSDVVRKIINDDNRKHLPLLDVEIVKELKKILKNCREEGKDVVIAGPRQMYIITALEVWCTLTNNKIEYHILETEESIRKQRYLRRNSTKDKNLTFEEAEEGDRTLGIDDVMSYFYIKSTAKIISNSTQYDNSIDDSLQEE